MRNKLCPLLYACPDAQCREERCAWWDEDSAACYFCTIAEALTDIAVNMEEAEK